VRHGRHRERNTHADDALIACVEHLVPGVQIDIANGVLRRDGAVLASVPRGVEMETLVYGEGLRALVGRLAFADGSQLIIKDGTMLPLSRCDLVGLQQEDIDVMLDVLREHADDDEEAQQ
jgi:hypothetical protein